MILPKCLKRYAAKISHYSDERGLGDGVWVTLHDGWCCAPATHTIHEDSPAECAQYFHGGTRAQVQPCECSDCAHAKNNC